MNAFTSGECKGSLTEAAFRRKVERVQGAELFPQGKVLVYDGVGVLFRGDTCLVVYQRPARIERTRWLFDVVENYLLDNDTDLLAFMIVLPSADPPDARTRQENNDRMRKIGHRIRRLVTMPIGNAFRVNIVRTIMRGLSLLAGHSDTRSIADTVEEGLDAILEVKSERTPPASQIRADIAEIYKALGEPVPTFPSIHPGKRSEPD
jgi:hypothetical protein